MEYYGNNELQLTLYLLFSHRTLFERMSAIMRTFLHIETTMQRILQNCVIALNVLLRVL